MSRLSEAYGRGLRKLIWFSPNEPMILSNDGLKRALKAGALEISPTPSDTQYTTSAVDLYLGDEFHVWDAEKLKFAGFKPELDLAQQKFAQTAKAFLVSLKKQMTVRSSFRHSETILTTCLRSRVSVSISIEISSLPHGLKAAAHLPVWGWWFI